MIGIIGAMEEEVAALKEEMQTEEVKEIAGMTFVKGVLCGRDAVVVRSGIGQCRSMCPDTGVRVRSGRADQYRDRGIS